MSNPSTFLRPLSFRDCQSLTGDRLASFAVPADRSHRQPNELRSVKNRHLTVSPAEWATLRGEEYGINQVPAAV